MKYDAGPGDQQVQLARYDWEYLLPLDILYHLGFG